MNKNASATRLNEYITALLPWAHGHQLNAISDFVAAIIDKQTGNQAALARSFGNQEAATRRLSRLLHNPRLPPHRLATRRPSSRGACGAMRWPSSNG